MKSVAVLTEYLAFALFCRPHPGGFDSSRVPTPGIFSRQVKKKMLIPGSQPGGGGGGGGVWVQLELTDALVGLPFFKFDELRLHWVFTV